MEQIKLENQVVNLELSEELKNNRYPQEGLWWWVVYVNKICVEEYQKIGLLLKGDIELGLRGKEKLFKEFYIAPTVAELGERLPIDFITMQTDPTSHSRKYNGRWCCYAPFKEALEGYQKSFYADTEANARAKMWLYLKKKGLL